MSNLVLAGTSATETPGACTEEGHVLSIGF